MLFRDAEKTIEGILYPEKHSLLKDEESREAIVLACEALKIVDKISERFKEFPEEIQAAFMEFRIYHASDRPAAVNDYAYRFVTETMDEIELLEDEETAHEMPI